MSSKPEKQDIIIVLISVRQCMRLAYPAESNLFWHQIHTFIEIWVHLLKHRCLSSILHVREWLSLREHLVGNHCRLHLWELIHTRRKQIRKFCPLRRMSVTQTRAPQNRLCEFWQYYRLCIIYFLSERLWYTQSCITLTFYVNQLLIKLIPPNAHLTSQPIGGSAICIAKILKFNYSAG